MGSGTVVISAVSPRLTTSLMTKSPAPPASGMVNGENFQAIWKSDKTVGAGVSTSRARVVVRNAPEWRTQRQWDRSSDQLCRFHW